MVLEGLYFPEDGKYFESERVESAPCNNFETQL